MIIIPAQLISINNLQRKTCVNLLINSCTVLPWISQQKGHSYVCLAEMAQLSEPKIGRWFSRALNTVCVIFLPMARRVGSQRNGVCCL